MNSMQLFSTCQKAGPVDLLTDDHRKMNCIPTTTKHHDNCFL